MWKFFSARFIDPQRVNSRVPPAFYFAEKGSKAGDANFQHPVLAEEDVRSVTIKKAHVE